MCSDDIAISVQHLTKTYRLFGHPGDRVKQFLSLGLKRYHANFTALSNISFEIRKGEAVGIIGRNGSGKSTLLQLICGILKPTSGTVRVQGKISALLELGAGFNPEFTGRENVYFQGALMGFTRAQIFARFDEIATFADIGEFMDQPVRTYSSGMFVRLAFSVAVNFGPDILVVDEALAVGDFSFRAKCYELIRRLTSAGTTLLFVSHDLDAVKSICHRTLYLSPSLRALDLSAGEACDAYLADQRSAGNGKIQATRISGTSRDVGKLAEILNISLSSSDDSGNSESFSYNATMQLTVRYRVLTDLDSLTVTFYIRDCRHVEIIGSSTRIANQDIIRPRRGDIGTIIFCFPNYLRAGEYGISVGLAADLNGQHTLPDWINESVYFRSDAHGVWALVGLPVKITHHIL